MSSLVNFIDAFIAEQNETSFAPLKTYVLSGEFRDEEFNVESYTKAFELLLNCVTSRTHLGGSAEIHRGVHAVILRILAAEEFNGEEAEQYIPSAIVPQVVARASPHKMLDSDIDEECTFIECVLREVYRKMPKVRSAIRGEVGKFLRDYSRFPTRTSHLTPILGVLCSIVAGMEAADKNLFMNVLLPLHKPNGWAFWDRQTPILGEYHKALVECCYMIVAKDHSLSTVLIEYLLTEAFPPVNQSNTPKELLLLYEISKFIDKADISRVLPRLMSRIIDSIHSENAQVAQSALVYWKSPPSNFPTLIMPFLSQYMDSLLLALFRSSGEPHWNPTVNKMTLLVLKCLHASDPDLFESSAERVIPRTNFPTVQSSSSGRAVPKSLAASVVSANQPPLGITGVAPWTEEPSVSHSHASHDDTFFNGKAAILHYMSLLEPIAGSTSTEDDKPWQSALSAESPTLLPDLKFHNLVFGKDLGIGSFSTVRYARVIKQRSYLSQWDEVAVKVISYDTISRHNYSENILREISCLRKLSHPSVARLISSFRWRDGIYMVLEYGAFGDLHTYVRRNGPLSEKAAKIVVGEITAAVAAVHETGFVYGDLKPENVVITATRHVKLADFGACRPYTREAVDMLLEARDTLSNMRSGDWKGAESAASPLTELSDEQILCPKTFEGTTAYMSPELVANPGQGPTVLSDAYALGLTAYFVIKGRLPQWSFDQSSTHFDSKKLVDTDPVFAEISDDMRSFILSLCGEVGERRCITDILTCAWFEEVQPVRRLYQRTLGMDHLENASDGGPLASKASEAAWEKRQLSKIWTAQPVDYALGVTNNVSDGNHSGDQIIVETDVERGSSFIT